MSRCPRGAVLCRSRKVQILDWLALTGGSIGLGLPYATGAAIACPDRKVICTEGDGSAMYTLQALWTQRERVAILLILFLIMARCDFKG